MAKPIVKTKKPTIPLGQAVQDLLESYGAKDWAIVMRGDLNLVLNRDKEAIKDAFWIGGEGVKGKEREDELRIELLAVDLQKLHFSVMEYLNKLKV